MADLLHRPTNDLDAIAIVAGGHYELARPLPDALVEAVADVAMTLGLDPEWLNPGPTDQLRQGLPEGFESRTSKLEIGGLTLQVAGRFDQISLKLYAAADAAPNSKHVVDLIGLEPTPDELAEASAWVKEQDAGVEFRSFDDAVIEHVEVARGKQ